jgi:hypothetical protein
MKHVYWKLVAMRKRLPEEIRTLEWVPLGTLAKNFGNMSPTGIFQLVS